MRSFGSCLAPQKTGVLFCCTLAIFFLLLPDVQARPARPRKRTVPVVLQPFSLVHKVVHAVAAPVVHNTHRVLVAAAAAPIRVAYYAPRRTKPRAPRAEQVVPDEESTQPIRVAYRASDRTHDVAPEENDDGGQDREESERIESRGDRPTVAVV